MTTEEAVTMTERLIEAAVYCETATGIYTRGARKEMFEARAAIEKALCDTAESRQSIHP